MFSSHEKDQTATWAPYSKYIIVISFQKKNKKKLVLYKRVTQFVSFPFFSFEDISNDIKIIEVTKKEI